MKLEFFGVLRDECDASNLFCFLEQYGLYYDVDVIAGKIVIHDIKPTIRERIISEVNDVFRIIEIKTEKTKVDDSGNIFEALERSLYNANLKRDSLKYVISSMTKESMLLHDSPHANIKSGDIFVCNFGFGLHAENKSSMHVLVLRPTENDKYLVVPINLNGSSMNKGFCMKVRRNIDATYYNDTYKKKNSVLYLNRIQEVHCSRLSKKLGMVTKWFLNSVYERFYSYNYEKPSLHLVIEELLLPAVNSAKNENSDSFHFQQFLQYVKIPYDMKLLKNTFSNALATKNSSLTSLIPLLQEDNESSLSKHAITERLRKEFVTWFGSLFPNIFDNYYRISLSDVLKVFLKCYNEII